MATSENNHLTTEQRLILICLFGTFPIYLLGASYVVGSVLGWLLLLIVLLRSFINGSNSIHVPMVVWVWVVAMGVMLIALWMGHADFNLGSGQTIKSSIGWAKGWALLALFPLLGACCALPQQQFIRACCWVGVQGILFALISLLAFVIGAPDTLYISPLKAVGGPGLQFFAVKLYGINPETGLPRWCFFAPWAPAAGLMSCLLLCLCVNEKNTLWRYLGILGAACICLLSQSRAGMAVFISIIPILIWLGHLRHSNILILTGIGIAFILTLGLPVLDWLMELYESIKSARPGSTRVRETLANLAIQRWHDEAFWWGHGIVENGPKSVEFMPIGTHHSWYGLLFTKGLVGALALAVALVTTIITLLVLAQRHRNARTALGLILVLTLYSFFENLDILAYIYWPALLYIGHGLKPILSKTENHHALA